jgi:colanic acid/amylovoran biosynthesis glycosyltransferase
MAAAPFKVVHYAPTWLPQTQTWLYRQLKSLPPEVESHVVCRSTRHLEQFEVPRIHCLKRDSFLGYLAHKGRFLAGRREGFPYFDAWLDAIRPDAVHSHFGNHGWTVREAVRRRGLPHFVTFYGQDLSRLPQSRPEWRDRYLDLFATASTRFLCEGRAMAASLADLGCPPEKITVQHLGVDVGNVDYRPRQWLPGEPLKVLIAAGFREKKGIPYALEALGKLRKEVPLELTLIGDAEPTAASRAEKRRILAALDAAGLAPAARLPGLCPYAVFRGELYRHHLFLATSVTAADGDTEGGAPVALVDVMASGMPIVASRHCDIPEIVRDGETGWLAEERDVEGIVAAVRRWLDAPGIWPGLLAAGRRHVEAEYDAARQGERLAALYRGEMTA